MDHKCELNLYKFVMISAGKYPILGDFWTPFLPKYPCAISMATGMTLDQVSDVLAKSVTMRATALCRKSGYRELLLKRSFP